VQTDSATTFPPFGAVTAKLKPAAKPVPPYVLLPEYQWNNGVDIGGQVGNDEAPEDEPSRQPRHQAAQPIAKRRRSDRDVIAAGVEAGRRLESTEREHILVHLRALRDRARSADDQKRTTDLRGAGELRVAEYDNDIPIDAAFDRRVPADDHDLADGFAGFEREVLEHSHGWVREPDARGIDFLRTDGAAAGQQSESKKQPRHPTLRSQPDTRHPSPRPAGSTPCQSP